MTCKKVNLVFNVDDDGNIVRLATMHDSDMILNEFISLKDMRQASFKCSGCRLKICVRIAFQFPYKEEQTDGKVMRIIHVDDLKPDVLEDVENKEEMECQELQLKVNAPHKQKVIGKVVDDGQGNTIIQYIKIRDQALDQETDLLPKILTDEIKLGGEECLDESDEHMVVEALDDEFQIEALEEPEIEAKPQIDVDDEFTEFEALDDVDEPVNESEILDVFSELKHENESVEEPEVTTYRRRPWWDPHRETETFYKGQCNICNANVSGCKDKISHMNEFHKIYQRVLCEICGRHFNEKRSYREHHEKHFPSTTTYSCTKCDKTFPYRLDLTSHGKEHSGSRFIIRDYKLACEICGKAFKVRQGLKKHIEFVHEKPKSNEFYRCAECPFSTRYTKSLKTHVAAMHGPEEGKAFACKVCNKRFTRRTTLRTHETVHTGERKNICEVCGKTFKQKCDLQTHAYLHTNEYKWGCRFCDKRFKDRGNKNAHQRKDHAKEMQAAQCQ